MTLTARKLVGWRSKHRFESCLGRSGPGSVAVSTAESYRGSIPRLQMGQLYFST